MHAGWTTQVATLTTLLTLCACAIDGPREEDPESQQEEVTERDPRVPPDDARPPLPIVQGSEATAYPSAAIVNMKKGDWTKSVCSGAVIAPRIVLTAGHCVAGDYDNWDIHVPYAGGQSSHSVQALIYDYSDTGGFVNPNQHDVALLVLQSDITLSTYPELASSAVSNGTQVRSIGRVADGVMHYTRLFVSQPVSVSKGNGYGFPYSFISSEVIQPGDSGGPVVQEGSFPHRIVAVNSGAGGGTQILARVDLVHTWIGEQIAAHGGTPAPPPPEGPTGACSHPICEEGGALVASCDPCTQQICDQDAYCCSTAWDAKCVSEVASVCGQTCGEAAPPPEPPPPSPSDPCGDVTYEGQCDGATLSWCENEQVSTVDCAQSGKQCSWDQGNSFFNCL